MIAGGRGVDGPAPPPIESEANVPLAVAVKLARFVPEIVIPGICVSAIENENGPTKVPAKTLGSAL